jgi:DNA polymerase IV
MEMPINNDPPMIMHIDLNSCFAIIEQQANPLIRYRPVAVAAYDTPKGMILASSYEAKAMGIKLGLSVGEARQVCPDLIVMMPDPDKYFDAHSRFKKVLLKYTSEVVSKSVDEFVIDFRGSPAVRSGDSLEEIGYRIKQDIKDEIGEYVTVNVGISTNRFLAKLATGLNKPDGLDTINADNLRQTYEKISLLDMPGINVRYQARLNLAGIYTALDFLDTPLNKLRKEVFKGIVGYYWYLRLKGHEIDSVDFGRKSFGQQYALGNKTSDLNELSRLLMKLSEKTGRRLRRGDYSANGINLSLRFEDRSHWHHSYKLGYQLYSTQDIYLAAYRLLKQAVGDVRVAHMAISVYGLVPNITDQLNLFGGTRHDSSSLAVAADLVNDRYGEFTLVPALMANMQDTIIKRVAFGKVNDM